MGTGKVGRPPKKKTIQKLSYIQRLLINGGGSLNNITYLLSKHKNVNAVKNVSVPDVSVPDVSDNNVKSEQAVLDNSIRCCKCDTLGENDPIYLCSHKTKDGKYCEKLFELFGKERVEKELEEFLSHNFFPRFGGGIGMTRMARAYQMIQK